MGESSADGRVLRSERSREAIVDALFELIGEGVLRPTAQQVAERAGVGLRTVFRHFSDMDKLFAELNERLVAEVRPLVQEAPADGSVEKRVLELVRRRAGLFERIAPYLRSSRVQRWKSPFLEEAHRTFVRRLRSELQRWVPELEKAAPEIADALEVATSFATWNRLRDEQRLSQRRAVSSMELTVRLLAAELERQGSRSR